MQETGDFTSNLAVIDKLANDDEFVHSLIGQNPYVFYKPIIDQFKDLLTQYDGTIESAFQNVMDSYLVGNITKDQMFADFKAKVRDAFQI